MADDPVRLRLVLPQADDSDPAELDELTRSLRRQILELEVDDVAAEPVGPPPPGSKGLDATTIGTLLVTMSGAGGLFVSLVETIRSWITGQSDRQRVVLEVGDAKLELSSATPEQRQALIDQFIAVTRAR